MAALDLYSGAIPAPTHTKAPADTKLGSSRSGSREYGSTKWLSIKKRAKSTEKKAIVLATSAPGITASQSNHFQPRVTRDHLLSGRLGIATQTEWRLARQGVAK